MILWNLENCIYPQNSHTANAKYGNQHTVMQTGSAVVEAKAYASQLKNAGFDKGIYEDTNEIAGYSIYTFTAENQNGLSVSLTFASGTTTVSFNKD